MTPIIAGRFEQEAQAEGAAAALRHGGFDAADVTVFFVNPAGQHATYPIGGDRDASPGAKHAHSGTLKGAAGAYAGSLVGALGKMEEKPAAAKPDEHVVEPAATVAPPRDTDTAFVRSSGIFVAVRAVAFAKRVAAVNVLGANGAQDIERADGTWQAGQWIDFDPLKPPLLVDLPAPEDVQLRK